MERRREARPGAAGARADPRARPVTSPAQAMGPAAGAVLGLQRLAGNRATAHLLEDPGPPGAAASAATPRSPVLDVIGRGGGRPLDPAVRQTMQERLGRSLASVRVHVDAKSAESVQAKAYTVGEEIVVHPRHYDPASVPGRHLLAHEAVHVVQQRAGPVAGTPVAGGISVSDPSDRFEREAEATAREVTAAAPQ